MHHQKSYLNEIPVNGKEGGRNLHQIEEISRAEINSIAEYFSIFSIKKGNV
jgi:hypothetical protein